MGRARPDCAPAATYFELFQHTLSRPGAGAVMTPEAYRGRAGCVLTAVLEQVPDFVFAERIEIVRHLDFSVQSTELPAARLLGQRAEPRDRFSGFRDDDLLA